MEGSKLPNKEYQYYFIKLGNLYFLVKGYIYLRGKFWSIELFSVRKSISSQIIRALS